MNNDLIKLIDNYIKKIKSVKTPKDMKKIVRKLFKDNRVDDIDFNDLLDNFVSPTLSSMGIDMSYDEENDLSTTDKILLEKY